MYKASNIWSSEFFSPVDMVLNILPGVVPAAILGSHFKVVGTFCSCVVALSFLSFDTGVDAVHSNSGVADGKAIASLFVPSLR